MVQKFNFLARYYGIEIPRFVTEFSAGVKSATVGAKQRTQYRRTLP
jgi:hypothetical protein